MKRAVSVDRRGENLLVSIESPLFGRFSYLPHISSAGFIGDGADIKSMADRLQWES